MDEMIMVDLYPLFHEARCVGREYGQRLLGGFRRGKKLIVRPTFRAGWRSFFSTFAPILVGTGHRSQIIVGGSDPMTLTCLTFWNWLI